MDGVRDVADAISVDAWIATRPFPNGVRLSMREAHRRYNRWAWELAGGLYCAGRADDRIYEAGEIEAGQRTVFSARNGKRYQAFTALLTADAEA